MLIRYFGGEVSLSFEGSDKSKVFDCLSRLDVQFTGVANGEEGFSLSVPFYRLKKIERALSSEGIVFERGRIRGFPSLLLRYRKRIGIPIGAVLALIMIYLSGQVIWCVDITGNSTVSDREITELLDSLGCGVGDRYGDIDFDILHNRFLMECEGISWISVNMNGTHANVEVREALKGEKAEEGGFYNIVASEAGQIEMIAAVEGKPVVEIYDTVLEGDLLISGAISYRQDTLSRFESAEGSVYATVKRTFSVEVPFVQETSVPTGEEIHRKSVRFFDFNINLFRNSRIPDTFCDTITMNKQVCLFRTVTLPLYIDETVYREMTPKTVTLSRESAKEKAMAQYRERLYEVLGDAELISKTVTEEMGEDFCRISCELYCLCDIAKKVPLEITKEIENINEETEK